jgi:diaminohydroxyphosphoribosylaminopyrimidine deaminase / 5-amino-6-(5-phosphoribosylamino)uracil reductase
VEINTKFLELACDKAWEYQGLTYPNPAVGAAVVKNGALISLEAHKKAGKPHAEVEALKSAFLLLSNDEQQKKILSSLSLSHEIHDFLTQNGKDIFRDCDIYVTLEPCAHEGKTPSCAKLLSVLHPKSVVIGKKENNDVAIGGAVILKSSGIDTVFVQNEACEELIEPFLRWQAGNFVFFKMAMTMNGKVSGGKISCDKSFFLVHQLREKIELLVIGGNTVRVDRPTLDARLTGGKAPNVLIYSKTNNFERNIPLFEVQDRQVSISNSLDMVKDYNFVMVEGGKGMLEATKNIVSHYLFFVSPKISGFSDLNSLDLSFKILHSHKVGDDLLIWAKKEL